MGFKGKRREREEPCSICGHYHDYEGGEPCAVCGHKLVAAPGGGPAPKPPSAFPTDVLPDFLYLGSYDHASRQELLKTLGIAYILNVVPGCQNLYKNSFTYHTASSSPPPFEECFDFLEGVRAAGGKCLVHCMSGSSRSPAVVVYYLMRHRGWRLSEAYSWVRDRRPQIAISVEDAARLQAAEAALLGPHASGFQVPVGQQPHAGGAPGAAGQQQGSSGGGPFGWPVRVPGAAAAPGFGGPTPGAAPAFGAAAPGGPPGMFSFGAAADGGAPFVFGGQQQPQQPPQQTDGGGDMME